VERVTLAVKGKLALIHHVSGFASLFAARLFFDFYFFFPPLSARSAKVVSFFPARHTKLTIGVLLHDTPVAYDNHLGESSHRSKKNKMK
jgi:hypothetical protein